MSLSFFRSLPPAACAFLLAMVPYLAASQSPKGCIGINYLGAEPGKPFSAQIITSGKSRTDTGESKPDASLVANFVARDRDGRIRDERSPVKEDSRPDRIVTLTWPDGTTRPIAQN